jgi:hypothetical protein
MEVAVMKRSLAPGLHLPVTTIWRLAMHIKQNMADNIKPSSVNLPAPTLAPHCNPWPHTREWCKKSLPLDFRNNPQQTIIPLNSSYTHHVGNSEILLLKLETQTWEFDQSVTFRNNCECCWLLGYMNHLKTI